MLASVIGDQRITNALQVGEQSVIIMSIAAVLLDRAPRQLSVIIAELIGIYDNYNFDKYRKKARTEAQKENLLPPPDEQIRYYMEEEIIAELDQYPADTYLKVIREVMEQDEFDDFLKECTLFWNTAKMLSSKFQSLSNGNSGSKTKK